MSQTQSNYSLGAVERHVVAECGVTLRLRRNRFRKGTDELLEPKRVAEVANRWLQRRMQAQGYLCGPVLSRQVSLQDFYSTARRVRVAFFARCVEDTNPVRTYVLQDLLDHSVYRPGQEILFPTLNLHAVTDL